MHILVTVEEIQASLASLCDSSREVGTLEMIVRRRDLNTRVIQPGAVRVGDMVSKIDAG